MSDIITTLKTDATAVENFLGDEGKKILAFAAKGEPAVVSAFENLIGQAKSDATPLVLAAATALSGELSNLEADFETAIANALQKVGGGNPETVILSQLGVTGMQQLATAAASLIQPLFVKVLAAMVPAVAAAV